MTPGIVDNRRLLKSQVKLPADKRQNCVLLEFAKPVASYHCQEFLRLGLSENMRNGAESVPYQVSVYKPSSKPRVCLSCETQISPRGVYHGVCENKKCQLNGKEWHWKPSQGVQKILFFDDFVSHVEGNIEHVKACVLMLDRRYEEPVLAAIKRTACELGSEMGWQVS